MKTMIKSALNALCLLLALPAALLAGFGRLRAMFTFFAQLFSLLPGLPGDYLRTAYYRLTLQRFALNSRISFGSFFAHPEVSVGRRVYIGSYSVIGRADIGEGCQIGSGVHVLSGRHQHQPGSSGAIGGSEAGVFQTVRIGAGCWIGAGAVVMADVGVNSTVGAGATVVKALPPGCVAVGSPARPLAKNQERA